MEQDRKSTPLKSLQGKIWQAGYASGELRGKARTAIELCTAAGVVGVLELLQQGKLPARGFVRQEQVPLRDFLATRVGHHYAHLDGHAPTPAENEAAHA